MELTSNLCECKLRFRLFYFKLIFRGKQKNVEFGVNHVLFGVNDVFFGVNMGKYARTKSWIRT